MAASNSSRSGGISEFQSKKLWRERERGEISPDRNVVWSEPQNLKLQRVPVLYYLSRNGQLQHPHFIEVPLSSPRGLFLKDVINRLNLLRGKGMAFMYSWSCKRSYKNGFVWYDLSENDLIYPAHGNDYILKGSELPENAVGSPVNQTAADRDHPLDRQRRNQSCSSIDFEYNVYKPESSSKSAAAAADVSTQTDDNGRRRLLTQPPDIAEEDRDCKELHRVEIEISTPPSDSSPETLGTLMKADGQERIRPETAVSSSHRPGHHIQRCRSSVLMQLISCGSMPFKDCGAGGGLGLIGGQHKMRAPRGGGTAETGGGKLEEKEYFSASLVETKKREFPVLKRSNSYNADRSLNLEVAEKEMERMKAKCIPSKTKAHSSTLKEGPLEQY